MCTYWTILRLSTHYLSQAFETCSMIVLFAAPQTGDESAENTKQYQLMYYNLGAQQKDGSCNCD